MTTKVEELVAAIGTDYNQKVDVFEKDRKSVIDSAYSASQNHSEATDSFRNSLNKIESKLNYSLITNIVLVIRIGRSYILYHEIIDF